MHKRYLKFCSDNNYVPRSIEEPPDSGSESDDSMSLTEWAKISAQLYDTSDEEAWEAEEREQKKEHIERSIKNEKVQQPVIKKESKTVKSVRSVKKTKKASVNSEPLAEKVQTFQCSVKKCKKQFKRLYSLTKHEKVHHSVPVIKKEIKSVKSVKKTSVKLESSAQTLQCSFKKCQKKFKKRSSLRKHEKVHSGKIWFYDLNKKI